MIKMILLVLALAVEGTWAKAIPENHPNYDNAIQAEILDLHYIGTVGSKSYFTENETAVTWEGAKEICSASGLELATIDSAAEAEMLKEAPASNYFDDAFWVGARDALTLDQFVWEKSGATPDYIPLGRVSAVMTCVNLYKSERSFRLDGDMCIAQFYSLCQTPSSK